MKIGQIVKFVLDMDLFVDNKFVGFYVKFNKFISLRKSWIIFFREILLVEKFI